MINAKTEWQLGRRTRAGELQAAVRGLIRRRGQRQAQAEQRAQAQRQSALAVACFGALELPAYAARQDVQLLALCSTKPIRSSTTHSGMPNFSTRMLMHCSSEARTCTSEAACMPACAGSMGMPSHRCVPAHPVTTTGQQCMPWRARRPQWRPAAQRPRPDSWQPAPAARAAPARLTPAAPRASPPGCRSAPDQATPRQFFGIDSLSPASGITLGSQTLTRGFRLCKRLHL